MRIPKQFLITDDSIRFLSKLGIFHFSRFRLIGGETFGPHSTFNNCEKIASLALKIFVVYPVLMVGMALDLVILALAVPVFLIRLMTNNCTVLNSKKNLKYYCIDLIASIAFPVLGLGLCIVGKSPDILCPRLMSYRTHAIVHANLNHFNNHSQEHVNLINQSFNNGLKLKDYEISDCIDRITNFQDYGVSEDSVKIDYKMLELILTKCNISTENFEKQLKRAAKSGDLKWIQLLINSMKSTTSIDPNHPSFHFFNLIMKLLAGQTLDPKAFELILKNFPIDLNAQDKNGVTPLATAIIMGRFECAQYLVSKGASFYETPFNQLIAFVNEFELNSEKSLQALMDEICPDKTNAYFKAIVVLFKAFYLKFLLPDAQDIAFRNPLVKKSFIKVIEKFKELDLEKQKNILINLNNKRTADLAPIVKNIFKNIYIDKCPVFTDAVAQKIAAYADMRTLCALPSVCKLEKAEKK